MAVRHRHADADVVLPRIAMQQRLERREQHHERRGRAALRAGLDRLRQRNRQCQRVAPGGIAGLRAARAVHRQRQHRVRIVERRLPVGELALAFTGVEPVALPRRVIGILDRQVRERRRFAEHTCAIERDQFLQQHLHRPAVRDDVVHRDGQQPAAGTLRRFAIQPRAQQRPGAEVERLVGQRARRRFQATARHRLVAPVDRHLLVEPGIDLAGRVRHEARAQYVVPRDDRRERVAQRRRIDVARQPQAARNVIRAARGRQLPQEPEPLLRVGCRATQACGGRQARNRRKFERAGRCHGRASRIGCADRRSRRVVGDAAGRLRRARRRRFPGQLRERQPLEQLLRRDRDAGLARTRHDLQPEQRIAAHFEEIPAAADTADVDLDHVGPDRRDGPLGVVLRRVRQLRSQVGHGRVGAQRLREMRLQLRAQCGAIELAVRVQRQRFERDRVGRHHVVGQHARGGFQQRGAARATDHERGEPRAARRLVREHGRATHAVEARERALDLGRLDAIAAHLDLIVGTATVFEQAVGADPAKVAGSVEPLASQERIGYEALGGQLRAPVVAARHAGAADVKLAVLAVGDARQVRVEQMDSHAGQRAAERQVTRGRGIGRPCMHRDADRGLGRAVVVEHAAGRRERGDPRQQRGGRALAADDQRGGRQHLLRPRGRQQRRQMARHDLQHADAMRGHVARERVGLEHQVRRDQMQRAARHQRAEQRRVAEVGGRRRDHRERGVGRRVERGEHAAHVVRERAMRDDHALRLAGRARGVDHVGGAIGMAQRRRDARRAHGGRRLVTKRERHGRCRLHAVRQRHRVQQHGRAAVGQLRRQARGGRARIERQPGRAGLQRGQHRQHVLDRAFGQHGDARLGADAECDEPRGQCVGRRVEFGIGHGTGAVAQREPGAVMRDAGVPQRQQVVGIVPVRCARLARIGGRRGIGHRAFERQRRRLDEPRRERREARHEARHERGVEHRVVIGKQAVDRCAAVGEIECEIEVRRLVRQHAQLRVERGETARIERPLLGQFDLEQRLVAVRAVRQQRAHQPVERHVLMLVRGQHGVAHGIEERREAALHVEARAQHLHVDEIADQRLRLGPLAQRNRRADADLVAPAQVVQHRVQHGQHRHERRRVPLGREAPQLRGHLARQREFDTALRAARVIRGSREQARGGGRIAVAGELRAPVIELPLQRGLAERGTLPGHIVGVLPRRRIRRRRTGSRRPARAGRVGPTERVEQHVHGPAVRHDVMQRDQQPVRLRRGPHQMRAQQRPGFEVERCLRDIARDAIEIGRRFADGQWQRDREPGLDDLQRLALVAEFETRAQHVVLAHHVAKREPQRLGVERAVEPQLAAHVVGGAGRIAQPGQPQAALRIGGDRDAARLGVERRERDARRRRAEREALADPCGRALQGRRGEHVARRVVDRPARLHGRGHLHGGERAAAEREEARRAGRPRRHGRQQLAPDPGQLRFDTGSCRACGGMVRAAARRRRIRRGVDALPLHERCIGIERTIAPAAPAGGALHLAARRLRQAARVQQHDHGGRLAAGDRDGLGQRGGDRLGRRDLAHVARHLGRDADALLPLHLDGERSHAPAPHEFDVALDRELEVLRIEIAATHDQQVLNAAGHEEFAVVDEAEIAGAQPDGAVALDEAGGRRIGAPPVAGRDARAAHEDLADRAGGQRRAALAFDDRDLVAARRRAARHQRGAGRVGQHAPALQRGGIEAGRARAASAPDAGHVERGLG